jgi:hypothetical protein
MYSPDFDFPPYFRSFSLVFFHLAVKNVDIKMHMGEKLKIEKVSAKGK